MSVVSAQTTRMMDDTKSIARSATTKHTTGTSRSISGKLNTMADNFNNFYGDLEEETTIRKQAEEQRVLNMEKELDKIEQVLGIETKRRIEAGKALQTMFENKVQALQKRFKADLRECFEPLQAQIDALVSRVELLESTMENERRDREKEIQKANKEVLDKFTEHQKRFEVEKVTRLQREAQTLKRVGDEVFRIQQKVTAERTARESAITLMKDDFMTAHKVSAANAAPLPPPKCSCGRLGRLCPDCRCRSLLLAHRHVRRLMRFSSLKCYERWLWWKRIWMWRQGIGKLLKSNSSML